MSTDERRERYAAAISAKTAWHGGTDLQEQADAAMAVADAEQRVKLGEQADTHMAVLRLLTDEQDAELARLRAERNSAARDAAWLKEENEHLRREHTRERSENDRLRAEIGCYDTNAELRAQLAEQLRQKDALRATIERVRDVLDSSEWHSHFKDKVRRALNGETR